MFCYHHTGTRVFNGVVFPKENFMASIRCAKKCPLLISFHFNITILEKTVKKLSCREKDSIVQSWQPRVLSSKKEASKNDKYLLKRKANNFK